MARIDMPADRLTDYERAICYHTLPRVAHPVTFGLIVAYTVCLVEAVALLIYGLVSQNILLARIGSISVYVIVAFGVVTFMLRALINEIRTRRILGAAKGIPDAHPDDAADIPDPFAGHALLQHVRWTKGDLFPCTDNKGNIMFFVETDSSKPMYRLKDPQDNEVLRVRIISGQASFTLGSGGPSRVAVYEGDTEVARINRRFSFTSPVYLVESTNGGRKRYRIRQGNIYLDKMLVGRMYALRKSLYLDIETEHLDKGILGLFITMT